MGYTLEKAGAPSEPSIMNISRGYKYLYFLLTSAKIAGLKSNTIENSSYLKSMFVYSVVFCVLSALNGGRVIETTPFLFFLFKRKKHLFNMFFPTKK